MIYKEFKGLNLSALGMGAMRLPVIDNDENRIDEEATARMVDHAMVKGINYYDTAWGYHGGNSEIVLGKALRKYPRDSYYFATKFPGYELENMSKVEEIFEKQLEKTGMEYFDFYMYHNVCEMTIGGYMDETNGIFKYLSEQKEKGRIKYLGLSAHGSIETMRRFLEAYGKDMDFCQIQLNYLDWTFQDAKGKVELLKEYDIPIFVMEPVRGGRLANLTDEQADALKKVRPEEAPVAWAFHFIQSIPEAVMTLSGMSDEKQLAENIRTFEAEKPLNDVEMGVILELAKEMVDEKSVPCTACRYCTGKCPQGLDIPYLLELYNEDKLTGNSFITIMALAALPEDEKPGQCIACSTCEQVCPQQIRISDAMKELEPKQNGFGA